MKTIPPSQGPSSCSLFCLLSCYEIRKAILQKLSAFDAAKLDVSLGYILDDYERETYLTPVRDLFWNITEMDELLREGMKLLLLGDDIPALESRLCNPKDYMRTYGNHRRLQVYLVGSFPLLDQSATTLDRMMKFGPSKGEYSKCRVFRDKAQLRRINQRMTYFESIDPGTMFLMAFGVPAVTDGEEKGLWYKIPETPEKTIDLRVYVPCFTDRTWNNVRIPLVEVPRIVGLRFNGLANLLKVYTGTYQFRGAAYLTKKRIQAFDGSGQSRLHVFFDKLFPSIRLAY